MSNVIIEVTGGVAEITFLSEGVNALVIDHDSHQLYTYQNSICKINNVNEDGTLDITLVSTSDGHAGNRKVYGIDMNELEWYGDEDDFEILDDENEL